MIKILSLVIGLLMFLTHSASAFGEEAHSISTRAIIQEQGYSTTINGVKLTVSFLAKDIAKIVKSTDDNSSNRINYSVLLDKPVSFSKRKLDNKVILTTDALQINIDTHSGVLTFMDSHKKMLLQEAQSAEINPLEEPVDGQQLFQVAQAFAFQEGEAIYGFGQHQGFNLNQRNQYLSLKHVNMEIGIPFFQSTNGYGLFWHNYSKTDFVDNNGVGRLTSDVAEHIEYYFLGGENADEVMKNYRTLTGQVPMFPLWSFGYVQSKERYQSQFELVDVVRKYRELRVPLDAVIQDWQYWGEDVDQWNSTEFHPSKYPRPKEMVDSIHAMNSHVLISVWPSFGSGSKIYQDFKKQNALFDFKTYPVSENVRVYDAFNPDARNTFWSYINKNLHAVGIDGWWLDATEPIVKEVTTKIVDNRHENEVRDMKEPIEGIETHIGSFHRYGNIYPVLTVENFYTNQRKNSEKKRVFILTRSGFAGQQQYGSMLWSGDVKSSWGALKQQIPAGLSLSYTGIPYWNSDIGGFHSSQTYPTGVKDKGFHELYVRWAQFAAFTGMMRSHGANTPREIYQFGKSGDWAYDAILKSINLRYRLLPYIYGNAWEITSQSSSLMRGLAMDFPQDKNVYDIANQYLFGRNLLVTPVTQSMYVKNGVEDFSKTQSQKVYLPQGTSWYDFWTGHAFEGGQYLEREVPIDLVPVYVRAGSILPLGPFQQYSNEKNWDNLEIRIYPGADGEFILYEDEGDSYNYEKGLYSEIALKWDDTSNTLRIADRKGEYPGMLKARTFNFIIVDPQGGIGVDVSGEMSKTVQYTGQETVVKF